MALARLKPDLAKPEQDLFASDALRYFLLREIVFGHDGNFSLDAVVERYNADLANGYGNLVSRTLAMTARYFDGAVPQGQSEPRIEEAFAHTSKLFVERLQTLEFSRGLEALWSFVAIVDGYITVQAPWKLASSSAETAKTDLANILYTCLEALRVITALVYPILPYSAAQVWAQLGLGEIASADLKNLRWGQLAPGTRLGASSPIFPRAEKEIIQRMKELETPGTPAPAAPATTESQPPAAAPVPSAEPVAAAAKIGIEDFAKVELRVGQVKVAERVKGADRLLRLEVDIGTEVRQIVAGLAEAYAPEALIGRKVVIVANLQPRKLRGLESNGMIVAASLGEGKPVLAGFLEEIEIGARLK